ncbi:hypothetical protein [Streptomyces fractus]|uniref:hypothetical protein n=1 Tax=Streptomyces fractus TaxID=641806 RepID=UPI003CEDA7EA
MFGQKTSTVDEMREALTQGLMESKASVLEPLFDAADGMRADLQSRGWSDDIVQYLAAQWLAAMLAKVGAA